MANAPMAGACCETEDSPCPTLVMVPLDRPMSNPRKPLRAAVARPAILFRSIVESDFGGCYIRTRGRWDVCFGENGDARDKSRRAGLLRTRHQCARGARR